MQLLAGLHLSSQMQVQQYKPETLLRQAPLAGQ